MKGLVRILLASVVIPSGIACSQEEKSPSVKAAGSTFVFPLMSKWVGEYKRAAHTEVMYQSIGSGRGVEQFIARAIDLACIDAPLSEEQMAKAQRANGKLVHVPLALGAVVPVYNLQSNRPIRFSGPVLADIFLGKITRWNDPGLARLNPEVALPNSNIVVVHRSDGSATTFLWTAFLSEFSAEWKAKVGASTFVTWPVGIGVKGGEGVAGPVRRMQDSIGYVELVYAVQYGMNVGLVLNREGEFVRPSLATITAAAQAASEEGPEDLRYSIVNAHGKASYPICGMVWAVAFTNNAGGKGKQIREFLRWATHEGQEFTAPLHYARLPKNLVQKLERKLGQID